MGKSIVFLNYVGLLRHNGCDNGRRAIHEHHLDDYEIEYEQIARGGEREKKC